MSNENTSSPEKASTSNEDKELADLLDSALEDFSTPADKTKQGEEVEKDSKEEDVEKVGGNPAESEWTEEFIRQAASQFESNISSILGNTDGGVEFTPEQIQQSFQKMAEAAAQVWANPAQPTDPPVDFATTISQTLQGLSEGTENLQNPFSEQDILSMFGQQSGDQNAFVPFMQGMMQSLLSKDVLYPSLKDILDKFPDWLQANGGTLPSEELQRYEKQRELMEQVCNELDKETEADSVEQKKARFEKVLGMMQKLQDYGQPPAELVGELNPGLQFDAQGNPDLNQCSLM